MPNNFRKRPGKDLPDNIITKRARQGTHQLSTTSPSPSPDLSSDISFNNSCTPEEILNELETYDTEKLESEQISSEDWDESSSDSSDDEEFNYEKELETLKKTSPDIYKQLTAVKEELKRTEPNVYKLFKIPLRLEDRAKLCQYYEIYKSQAPNTNEWLEARTHFNEMLKEFKIGYEHHCKFTKEEHAIMKLEEKKLSNFDAQLALKYKILSLNTSHANKSVIYKRYEEMLLLDTTNDEYSKAKHWLKWATEIPHDNIKKISMPNITKFIAQASQKLDKELFGMKKVKEQILLFLSAKIANPDMKRSNLGLVGPPGVGKTAIARLVADIMDWGFEQISLGGMEKADFLKGHEYTYVGAQPGEIVRCLRRMGHKNGVIFLDELDKAAIHPDIRSALLHLVDQSQNHDFKDNFLGEISLDLSHIWYIGSMNKIPQDEALADRWWVIQVKGYGNEEKAQILENYLLPKALKNIGMETDMVRFNKHGISYLLQKICSSQNKGVRSLQKSVADLVNKIHFILTHQNKSGKLPFSMSFSIGKQLCSPVILDNTLLEILLDNKELNSMLSLMYL